MRWQDIEATVHIAVIARTDHTVLIGRGRPIIPIIRPLLHPEIRRHPRIAGQLYPRIENPLNEHLRGGCQSTDRFIG